MPALKQIVIYFVDELERPPFKIPEEDTSFTINDVGIQLTQSIPAPSSKPKGDFIAIRHIGSFRVSEISRIIREDVPSPTELLVEQVGDLPESDE